MSQKHNRLWSLESISHPRNNNSHLGVSLTYPVSRAKYEFSPCFWLSLKHQGSRYVTLPAASSVMNIDF